MRQPILLPIPREILLTGDQHPLPVNSTITISQQSLLFSAQAVQTALKDHVDREWPIEASSSTVISGFNLTIQAELAPQAYSLDIVNGQVNIQGGDEAAIFYGVQTFIQLLKTYGDQFPDIHITDHPDYPVRGVMLDISRDRVPRMETMYALVDLLASWKLNHLQLYMEHSFAYSQHKTVWEDASPFTAQEILDLQAYCQQRHIDLVPNQNSFGHMERWLKHADYKHLAECADGFIGDFGDHMGERRPATSLNPTDPASIALISELYDELLPNFTSEFFNVGGDEPWEMGQCASKALCEAVGRGRVYVDYLLKLYELVKARGKTMIFWADVITKYPELLPDMPKDMIALEWGYYVGHPYSEHAPMFAQSGIPFYVCPGTSSWNTLSGRTDNAIGNIRDAVKTGLEYGASGVLMTDWGDRGHWQPLPISYLGYAYGLGMAWCAETNETMDIATVLNQFAFKDSAGVMGQVMADLGNLYQLDGLAYPNGSLLFFLLQLNNNDLNAFISNLDTQVVTDQFFGLKEASLRECRDRLNDLRQRLHRTRMEREDATLIIEEVGLVIDLLAHACKRGLHLLGDVRFSSESLYTELEALIVRQRANWLERSRPGGLEHSLLRFKPVLRQYQGYDFTDDTPSYL